MVYMSDVSDIPVEAWKTIETSGHPGPHPYQLFLVDCLRPSRLAAHFGVKVTELLK
jgi:hypothetical protein